MKAIVLLGLTAGVSAFGAGNCQVRTYFAHDVSGGQCWFSDEIMVGVRSLDPLTVRCAKLEVRCDRPEDAVEADRDTGARR